MLCTCVFVGYFLIRGFSLLRTHSLSQFECQMPLQQDPTRTNTRTLRYSVFSNLLRSGAYLLSSKFVFLFPKPVCTERLQSAAIYTLTSGLLKALFRNCFEKLMPRKQGQITLEVHTGFDRIVKRGLRTFIIINIESGIGLVQTRNDV